MKTNDKLIPKKTIAVGAVLFILLFWFTVRKIFRELSLEHLSELLKSADLRYILLGAGLMVVYAFAEGLNIWRLLRASGYRKSLIGCYKYAAVGIFFNAITPSSSGGQPVQLFFMCSDGIHISHGMLSIFNNLLGYQIAAVALSATGLLLNIRMLKNELGPMIWLLVLGIVINAVIALALAVFIFSRSFAEKAAKAFGRAAGVISKNLEKKIAEKTEGFISEYGGCADYIRKNPKELVKTCLISLVQVCAMFAVPYCAGMSLGAAEAPLISFMLIQAVVFVGVGFIPLPGAMGINEMMAISVYRGFLAAEAVSDVTLLSRSLSLYMWMAVYGVMILVWAVRLGRRR